MQFIWHEAVATSINNGASSGRPYSSINNHEVPCDSFAAGIVFVTEVWWNYHCNCSWEVSSLLLTGLQPTDSIIDVQPFTDLCIKEFVTQPDVVSTKRIRRFQPDKILSLLVTLRQADQAQYLIANARRLRKSTDINVRKQVYINPNLTRAEAAYKARVHRCQITKSRSDRQG